MQSKNKNYPDTASAEPIYVGIDIASQWLDVWLDPFGLCRRFANTKEGMAELVNWLGGYCSVSCVAMEATGLLERRCARALREAGYTVAVVNPSQIAGFRRAVGQVAKTDQLDAKTIARFARSIPLESRPAAARHVEDLRDLGARLRQITQMLTAERNRLKRADHDIATSSIKATIAFLTQERKQVEIAMK